MNSYLEAITALGGGSLHPGGFSHTLEVLRKVPISADDIVLDIGCGTGRTACHIAKTYGAHVFALDYSEKMLAKAKSRSEQIGVDVHFILGDALDMPFRNEVADVIFMESVLLFLPVRDVLGECFRVLKRTGILIAVEMVAGESLPKNDRERIMTICGLSQIPSIREWIQHFEDAGFTKAVIKQNKFPGLVDNLKEMLHLDPHQVVSRELKTDRKLNQVLMHYKGLILRNRRHLGFGTFMVRKD